MQHYPTERALLTLFKSREAQRIAPGRPSKAATRQAARLKAAKFVTFSTAENIT
jgi:hypothetical protein